jgi:hypothetical protein
MKNLIEVSVDSIRIHMPTAQHLVILKEKEADRYLPIWIGSFEAQAIATKISGNPLGRPLTHDLMATAFGDLGVSVKRIVVTRLATRSSTRGCTSNRTGATSTSTHGRQTRSPSRCESSARSSLRPR